MSQQFSNEIDFVITWVDGNDPAWRKEKAKYAPSKNTDDCDERYRDMDLLRYWFRAVEKYAPWVRKIHFVTCGQIPAWMNTDHPKLHPVSHQDYMPEAYLPTFNSNPIEMSFHRIEGLSEHFVYFNDDVFLNAPVEPEDFFRNGLPCDMLAFQPVVANPLNPVMSHLFLNNSLVLCKYFRKRENVMKQPGAYFHIGYPPLYFFYNLLELAFPLYTGFYTVHGAAPFLKSTFTEIWEKEPELLHETSCHKFRSADDVTDYLVRDWQKLSGRFVPKNITRDFSYFNLKAHNPELLKTIRKQKKKTICINDSNLAFDFEQAKEELSKTFSEAYPEKSAFEK